MTKIIYNGDSKVIKRICELINDLEENGGGGSGTSNAFFIDSEGYISIDYDLLEVRNNGE